MSPIRRSLFRFRAAWSNLARRPIDVRLRHEFNLWAEYGRGEGMERDHRVLAEHMMDSMKCQPHDRILDLACGEGWASRLLARRFGPAIQVTGIDIADEMVRRARRKSLGYPNVEIRCGSARCIPYPDGFFAKAFCIESFYYFEGQQEVLRELRRVLRPNGELFLLLCLYSDNPGSLSFPQQLRVPVHLRGAADYESLLRVAGYRNIEVEELVADHAGRSKPGFHDRALIIRGQTPKGT